MGYIVVPAPPACHSGQGGGCRAQEAVDEAAAPPLALVAIPQGIRLDTYHLGNDVIDDSLLALCEDVCPTDAALADGGEQAFMRVRASLFAQDDGNEALDVFGAQGEEDAHFMVNPVHAFLVGGEGMPGAEDDKVARLLERLADGFGELINAQFFLVEENRPQVLRDVGKLVAEDARQLVVLQLVVQLFGNDVVFVAVADEGVVGEVLVHGAGELLSALCQIVCRLSSPGCVCRKGRVCVSEMKTPFCRLE